MSHVQATGRDDRGRKQFRCHPDFRNYREQYKFEQLVEFGRLLPRLRRNVDNNLSGGECLADPHGICRYRNTKRHRCLEVD